MGISEVDWESQYSPHYPTAHKDLQVETYKISFSQEADSDIDSMAPRELNIKHGHKQIL